MGNLIRGSNALKALNEGKVLVMKSVIEEYAIWLGDYLRFNRGELEYRVSNPGSQWVRVKHVTLEHFNQIAFTVLEKKAYTTDEARVLMHHGGKKMRSKQWIASIYCYFDNKALHVVDNEGGLLDMSSDCYTNTLWEVYDD